jgi:hypothetical protein
VLRRGGRNLVLQAARTRATTPGEIVIKAVLGAENLLLREAAALRFLATQESLGVFFPRLLAVDPAAGVVVLEHVAGETLESILAGADAGRAAAAVNATARALGAIHATTADRVADWEAQPGVNRMPPAAQAEAFRELAPAIVGFCGRAGVNLPVCFREELGEIANALECPGRWLAFTVGDMAPSNVILGEVGPVFLDLEYADYRHAGYDAAFWHCIAPLPERVVAAADRAYHAGWVEVAGPVEAEELLRQTALLAAHRAFWALTWGASRIWETDDEVAAGVSARRLRRWWLRGFGRVARRADVLPELAGLADEMDRALGRIWPETEGAAVPFAAFARG